VLNCAHFPLVVFSRLTFVVFSAVITGLIRHFWIGTGKVITVIHQSVVPGLANFYFSYSIVREPYPSLDAKERNGSSLDRMPYNLYPYDQPHDDSISVIIIDFWLKFTWCRTILLVLF
jgi:hypothetical protein